MPRLLGRRRRVLAAGQRHLAVLAPLPHGFELGDCRRTLRVLASRAYDLELHAVFVDPPDDEGDGVPYPDAARLEIRSLE